MNNLRRRGFDLGDTRDAPKPSTNELSIEHIDARWGCGKSILLGAQFADSLASIKSQLNVSERLVSALYEERDCDGVLAQSPYLERLEPKFQSLGSTFNEGDDQEIEMVVFDVVEGDNIVAEDLWMKASWLSFHDDDASLRFRFSFGIDQQQDVAADPHRQQLAAELTDAVFPESSVITQNTDLQKTLRHLLGDRDAKFVERIIYFNAPNGGAYLHHDLERGHAGVVFAQLSGKTFWLALPKRELVDEIIAFSKTHPWPDSMTLEMRSEMSDLLCDRVYLAEQLGSFSNGTLIHLINETKDFVQFLIARGHSQTLTAGDVLLLPQATEEACCWHSVFCIGDEVGQALSFAIRAA